MVAEAKNNNADLVVLPVRVIKTKIYMWDQNVCVMRLITAAQRWHENMFLVSLLHAISSLLGAYAKEIIVLARVKPYIYKSLIIAGIIVFCANIYIRL